jgi:SAM-dependent methyltransferase
MLLRALLAQVLALGIALMLMPVLANWLPSYLAWPWVQGTLAAGLSAIFGLPLWWWFIQGLFLPLALLLLQQAINPLWYLLGLVSLLLLLPGAIKDRVPLYLSSRKTQRQLVALLPQRSGAQFLDLGCGTGQLLSALAKARPDMAFHGIESSPLLFIVAWWRTGSLANCRVSWGSFWRLDLADYEIVYAFLSPAPMERLWRQAKAQMSTGSLLISNSFAIPEQAPDERYPLHNGPETELLVWHIKTGKTSNA